MTHRAPLHYHCHWFVQSEPQPGHGERTAIAATAFGLLETVCLESAGRHPPPPSSGAAIIFMNKLFNNLRRRVAAIFHVTSQGLELERQQLTRGRKQNSAKPKSLCPQQIVQTRKE